MRLAPWLLQCAEGGWLRPQAEAEKDIFEAEQALTQALCNAARDGDLTTLTRLLEEGVSVNATFVSAAPPAAPRPPPSPPATPPLLCPALTPPPLTACGAAAAPPQDSWTAIMWAAGKDKLDCLDHLIAKGANLNAQNLVRRGPAVLCGVAARGVG